MSKVVYHSKEEACETKGKQATESGLELDFSNMSFEFTFSCCIADA